MMNRQLGKLPQRLQACLSESSRKVSRVLEARMHAQPLSTMLATASAPTLPCRSQVASSQIHLSFSAPCVRSNPTGACAVVQTNALPLASAKSLALRQVAKSFHTTAILAKSAPSKPPVVEYKGKNAVPDFIDNWSKERFYMVGIAGTIGTGIAYAMEGLCQQTGAMMILIAGYWFLGYRDLTQDRHTILRNFPVLGRIRYILEILRPEIRQYFIESDSEAVPFTRAQREGIYQRAKNMPDTIPLGTRHDVYTVGYEWVLHSLHPSVVKEENMRIMIGNKDCKQPYSAALLNVSGMSYGALSDNAILALNEGAKLGNFYHNTGEGGMSRFHLQPGGDLVWNIGTGYFGCRTKDGKFDEHRFKEQAARPQLKMVELKLSQGAKPGHGGMLPKAKVTPFIAEARGIEMGVDCNSPPAHSAFKDADGLVLFLAKLRELSGGKPVGFKLCVGLPEEFAAIIHAMIRHNVYPDFITIDGAEGGTGAAPREFSNHVGMPMIEALVLVDSMLKGAGIRDHMKLIASGKIYSGFTMVRALALGADVCNSARAMMFALGCIQSLKCNTNHCPTGVATQDRRLMEGLIVADKSVRVYNFQRKAVEAACELIGAVGLDDPNKLERKHIMRRVSETRCLSYAELVPEVPKGCLLNGTGPDKLQDAFSRSMIDSSTVSTTL